MPRLGFHSACWMMLAAACLAPSAPAQPVGTCADAEAEAYLDVNNVRARIFNNGALFWRGGPSVYEVPKGSGVSALFNTSIWIGGRVRGEPRVAGTRYGPAQFWPGPLDAAGSPPSNCAPFDHIYEITRADLAEYARTAEPTANLTGWPWHLGAPVLDGDGDPANYNLQGGDLPALVGDQMLWWIMNDAGGEHKVTGSDTPPLGMEVQGSAFAFARPNSPFDTITFYRYVLHYKGAAPLEDAYFGLYIDVDLGNFDDDYVGSDSMLHLGFSYNADAFDDGRDGYGEAPPAVGVTFLRSAAAETDGRDNDRDGTVDEPGEQRRMDSFTCVGKTDWRYGEPNTGTRYYNCLQGLWANGVPVTVGGDGITFSDTPTRFMLPGDPVTGAFWSMENIDGAGTRNHPHDVMFAMSTGPFTMQPGQTQEVLFAIAWARGDDRLDSVRLLKQHVAKLHRVADAVVQPDTAALAPPPPPVAPAPLLDFGPNYPNPFSEETTIPYSLPKPLHVRLAVYDVLGREVAVLVDARHEAGRYTARFDARTVPPGVYLARFDIDAARFTKTMLVMR